MERVARTNRSIEFKHMNISAVLEELGLPTIDGYKAKHHYQDALVYAVERYLSSNPGVFATPDSWTVQGVSEPPSLFETLPPVLQEKPRQRSAPLERLVRKFDPRARDHKNRVLGRAGEEAVFFSERGRLIAAGREDLARKVRWISEEDGDGAGYDIASFSSDGVERLLEVKTTGGGARTPFFLTRNEEAFSRERPEVFRLVRVYDFPRQPALFRLKPPFQEKTLMETETWRVSFG